MNDDGRVASKNRVKKESTRRSNSRSYDTPLFRSYIRIENLLFFRSTRRYKFTIYRKQTSIFTNNRGK